MTLGERMKEYEAVTKLKLIRRTPAIIRLDGKAFHTYTRGFDKPWDWRMSIAMTETAKFICENVMGAKFAYTQSDEISILITDYYGINTEAWFDYQVQKVVSVSSSLATYKFNEVMRGLGINKAAFFDARVANYPKEEVCNYFIWRQKDAERNSVQGLAQSLFSHKELQGVSNKKLQDEMFTEKGVNWNEISVINKRGAGIIKEHYERDGAERSRWVTDLNTPVFVEDRQYIETFVNPETTK